MGEVELMIIKMEQTRKEFKPKANGGDCGWVICVPFARVE